MSQSNPSNAATSRVPDPVIPADERLAHEETVELDGHSELLVTIVEAVAAVRDLPVTDIVPTIHNVIDPDGLERIFRPHSCAPNRSGWVTFFFAGCRVVLHGDGRLHIYERRPTGADPAECQPTD
jgi:hypothetical protein